MTQGMTQGMGNSVSRQRNSFLCFGHKVQAKGIFKYLVVWATGVRVGGQGA